VSVVLFINNLSPFEMDELWPGVEYSFATGARVTVHARDTLADLSNGVMMSPGVETTLAVNQFRRKRLTEPWDICTDRQYLYDETEENENNRIRYTLDSCYSSCAQNQV